MLSFSTHAPALTRLLKESNAHVADRNSFKKTLKTLNAFLQEHMPYISVFIETNQHGAPVYAISSSLEIGSGIYNAAPGLLTADIVIDAAMHFYRTPAQLHKIYRRQQDKINELMDSVLYLEPTKSLDKIHYHIQILCYRNVNVARLLAVISSYDEQDDEKQDGSAPPASASPAPRARF